MRCWALQSMVVTGVLLLGCDRAIEPYVPGEKAEKPDLARIFPDASEPAREAPPLSRGPRGAPPPPPSDEGQPSGKQQVIRGVVRVADEWSNEIPGGAALFVIARNEGGGPPLAVKRVDGARFPLEFSLGPDDRMIATRPFRGPLELSAWIDQDGNVTSRVPGDLQGTAPGRFEPGVSGVEIVVDQRL